MALRVSYRTALGLLGVVLKFMSIPLVLPLLVAIFYGESVLPFVVAIGVTLAVGFGLERLEPDPDLGHREGFLLVALTWLAVPILGTIPYLVAGQGSVAHPVDALFESMSGFTTTGATVLDDISFETHSRSILLWRQLTQWLGGMGIIVLMVAILPRLSVGGVQLMEHEAPGFAIEKLTPNIKSTARALWRIYAALTIVLIAVLYALNLVGAAPNMDLYNAVAHAFTTMPTGGFSPEARSIEAFSPIVQWSIMPFMVIAGTNFALLWYALHGTPKRLVNNSEFRTYIGALAAVGSILIVLLYLGIGLEETPMNVGPIPSEFETSVRHALFQAVAIVTTTGYASMDFNTWSEPAKTILFFSMFLGGSVGSAAGSIKIIRWYTIHRVIKRELITTVHPELVRPIRYSDGILDEKTVNGLLAFTLVFLGLFAVSTLLIYLDAIRTGLSLTALEAMSAALATLGNIGPGFGILGPMNNYAPFSDATKLYMVFLMWIGRLEILSVLVIFTPTYWQS